MLVCSGVPNGAARQNSRSSYRIWASWEKLHWLISWLGNLNERLASWKYGKFMPFLAGYKGIILSPGNRTVRVSEASKCAWKSPHATRRKRPVENDNKRKFVWVRQQNVLPWMPIRYTYWENDTVKSSTAHRCFSRFAVDPLWKTLLCLRVLIRLSRYQLLAYVLF